MTKQKLSYRLALWIVAASTLLTLFATAFYLKQEYDSKITEFERYIDSIKQNNEKILEISMWHFDQTAINGILEDIVDYEIVTYAQITISSDVVFSKGTKQKENVLEKSYTIRKENNGHIYKIGAFQVQGNLNYVKEQIIHSALNIIFFEIIKVILMAFFVMALIKKLFINNLEKLADYTAHLNIHNLDEKLVLDETKKKDKYDELDMVVLSFNQMRENLQKEIENSNQIKQELVSFRHAVEKSYNSIVITDIHRKIIYVNEVFEKTTGYTKQEVIGKNPNILKPKDAHALYYKNMNKTLNKGQVWQGELVNVKKDGSYFYEQASIIPIYTDNKLTNYLAIKLDITEYKESEFKINKLNIELEEKVKQRTNELELTNLELMESIDNLKKTKEKLQETEKIANIARKQAEEANREKSMLLANISHELKTPLNGISGLVYLCELKTKDEEVLKNLTNINNYSETLLRMISDLLDTSKMDAKKIDIIDKPFNLVQQLKSIEQIYKIECKKKNINFALSYDKQMPQEFISDSIRIHQVITNLINNAIKFTNKNQGYVHLNVHYDLLENKNVKFTFEIKDNGIGIKKEDLKTVFKPFYQTKESLNHYAGGSGLGLNICKNIIEQMNGIIWVDSKLNQGSSFFVSLELTPAPKRLSLPAKGIKEIQLNNESALVLVVDDNQINLEVLEGILHSQKIDCLLATNGQEALDLMQSNKFDLVLSDIKMPIMDGCELTNKIRETYTKEELPIVLISANTKDNACSCIERGYVNDYMVKPINPKLFLNILSKYIGIRNVLPKKSFKEEPLEDSNTQILDMKEALERFVNNEKLYKNALKDFINEAINSPFKIRQFLEHNEHSELIDYLHSIKGLSGNLSAKRLSKLARKLHDAIKYGNDYKKLLTKYEEALLEVEVAIEDYTKSNQESEHIIEKSNDKDFINEKNKALKELLQLTKTFNTKSVHYFDTLSAQLNQDRLLQKIKEALLKYNFKEATSLIESHFDQNNDYSI